VQDAKAQAASAQTTADSAKGSDLDLKVAWKGAPQFSSGDGKKFTFKVRGRLEVDYEHANQDTAVTTFPDISATELRRARLGVEGVMFYDLKYVLEVDFANDSVVAKDAYLQYQGVKIGENPLLFRAGNFKTPNTLEDLTSDLYVDTLERAAFINAWQIDRQIGFMTAYYADHFGLSAGIFGDRPSSTASNPLFPGFIGDEDTTFAARATVAPINRETNGVLQVLHFGASVRQRESGDDQPLFQYQARGADLHMTNFADNTGRIGDSDTFWGLETAALWGPFSAQAEYGHLDVDLPNGAFIRSNPPGSGLLAGAANPFVGIPDPSYSGWYVEGTWFFGGHRTWDKEGKFARPKIDNPMRWSEGTGWGALQLVGKYDVLDQSDNSFNNAFNPAATVSSSSGSPNFVGGCPTTRLYPNLATANGSLQAASIAQCGEMKTWSVGANWYLNDYTRLMFQYSESDLSGYPTTVLAATATQPKSGPVAGFDGGTIRGFGMRAQVDW
jgi:phosphate-selective porin OprO/OprP